MLFNFQLRALSEVTPWVYQGQFYLNWFGLTEGWYWLQVNENDEIFRYSPELLAYWQAEDLGEPRFLPYADYYVVRFWEDLLEILPRILEPLPPRLAQMLETEDQVNQWQERVRQWENLFEANEEEEEEETEEEEKAGREMWDTYMRASSWWYDRKLSASPLIAGLGLWFWNNGLYIYACWDNRQQCINNIPAWSAQKGQIQLTCAQFLDEVQAFHACLFAEMANRIQEMKDTYQPELTDRAPMPAAFSAKRAESQKIYVPLPQKGADPEERFWPHSDVAVNLAKLEEEQQTRFQWLASSLGRVSSREAINVNAVLNAMTEMDRFAGLSSE
ncbi:MAG: DUF5984 family protein [Ktedonobacteraceae bacterium]